MKKKVSYNRAQINFSKLCREKLYGKNLLILVSPERPLCLRLMGRKFCFSWLMHQLLTP